MALVKNAQGQWYDDTTGLPLATANMPAPVQQAPVQQAPVQNSQTPPISQPQIPKPSAPTPGISNEIDVNRTASRFALRGLIGDRPSSVDPNVKEFFDKSTGQGFANEGELFSFIKNKTGRQDITDFGQFDQLYNAPLSETNQAAQTNQTLDVKTEESKPAEVNPVQAFKDVYKNLYEELGLGSLKDRISSVTKDMQTLENTKLEELQRLSDDPFISESKRSQRAQQIAEKYDGKQRALAAKLQLDQGLFEEGQEQIRFIAGKQFDFDSQQFSRAQERAEKEAEAQRILGIQAQDFAADRNIRTPYYKIGTIVYETATRLPFFSEADFKKRTGMGIGQAEAQGLIGVPGPSLKEREFAFDKSLDLAKLGLDQAKLDFDKFKYENPKFDPNTMTDNERAMLNTFTSNPIVKEFNEVQSKKLQVDNIIKNGIGGPADLALVYTFMKALDPSSVVRETEYETARKSGNIFAGTFAKFNGYFKEEGGFLPDNVRKQFQNLTNQSYKAREQQYNNWRDEIKEIAERQGLNPDNVAPDFGAAISNDPVNLTPLNGNHPFRFTPLGNKYPYQEVFEYTKQFPNATESDIQRGLKELGFSSVGKTSASKPYLKTLGNITAYGSSAWKYGLDIDLKKGQPVRTPISGKIIATSVNGGFGKQIKIQGDDGREYWFSHMDGYKVKPGQRIFAGAVIGLGGNSGNVIPMGGGDGSHLDLTVKQNGKYLPPKIIAQLLKNTYI